MFDLFSNESFLFLLIINVVAATGMNLAYVTGQLNVGQAGFMAIGAYTAALIDIHLGWPLPLALLAAGAASGLAAAPVALAASRLRGVYLIMGTLAAGEVIRVVLGNIEPIGAGQGLSGISPVGLAEAAWSAAGILFGAWALMSSLAGLQMRAVFDDEEAAAATGINTRRVKIFAILVSAAVVGMAGGLLARWLLFIAPRNFGIDLSFRIALFSLIGGVHSLIGAAAGALSLTTLLEMLKRFGEIDGLPAWAAEIGRWRMVIFGALVMLIMAVRPEGLVTREAGLATGRLVRSLRRTSRLRRLKKAAPDRGLSVPATPDIYAEESPPGGALAPVLEFNSVSHAFGGVRAVADMTLSVYPGEILALIGANGAGKTTLINLAAGRFRLQSGSIRLLDREIGHWSVAARARAGLSRSFQTVRVFSHLTVEEQIRIGKLARSGRRGVPVARLIREIGLAGREDALPKALSLAEEQHLEIGRAAASMPVVLLLDEPSAGMNESERIQLAALVRRIRSRGASIVLIDHNLDLAFSLADRVAVMDFGELLMVASPDEVLQDPRVRAAYLGQLEAV